MKFLPALLALCFCLLAYCPLSAAPPSDSLAELMIVRIKQFITAANYDSASACGYELLTYARSRKLPLYEAYGWSTLGIVAYNKNDAEAALVYFDSTLSIRRRYLGADHEEVLRTLANIASVQSELLGNPEAAIELLMEEEQICSRRKGGCADQLLGLLFNNIGNAHAARGNYELAEQYYQKSYAIRSSHPEDPLYKLAALLNNFGSLKIETGQLAQAQDYLLRSEDLYRQWNHGKATLDLITIWQNLGTIANFENRFEAAKTWFRQALQLGKTEAENQYLEYGALQYNLGTVLLEEDSLDAAAAHFQEAIEFWKTNFGFHPDQPTANLGLGMIAAKRGDDATALAQFQEAEKLNEANFPPQHPRLAYTYKVIGNYYDNHGDWAEARSYYLKQLKALGMETVRASALNAARPSYLLLAGLTDLGKLHFDEFRRHQDTAQLEAALRVFALGDSVLNKLREIRLTFAEQKELLRDARRLAEWAMQAEIARYGIHSERIFERSEQTRAFSLFAKFREDAAIRFAGVPDSLTARYRSIQYEIARTEALYSLLASTDAGYFQTQAHLAALRQDLTQIKSKLSRFERYYKFRFGTPTASLHEVQQKILRPGELMVQYFVGDSALFIFTIGKNRHDTHVIPLDFQLDRKVKAMWQGITAYYTGEKQDSALWESSLIEYESNAFELYNRLVLPLQLSLADSNIIVVPDGILWLLPFDALLTGQPEERGAFNRYPYFLNRHRTSFAYSATLLREVAARPQILLNKKPLFACAPFDQAYALESPNTRRKFGQLPESGLEVKEAQRLLEGNILLGPEATKSAVLSRISQYRILLFSTHGQAGEDGFVAFYPEKGKFSDQNLLFVPEVYNVGINADLVIFSACETALGKSEPGEGLVSMARAFSYAGARGLVTTLWSVNDYSNSRITIALCNHLKKGESAFKALGNAKRDWLKSASSESVHPWFWAGVIGFGVLR